MGNTVDTLTHLIERESWTPLQTKRKKPHRPEGVGGFLARCIRLTAAHCSMASWGLPFEAIASSMLIDHRENKKERKRLRRQHGKSKR